MGGEDYRNQDTSERHGAPDKRMCCVFWCREAAVIIVQLNNKKHGCCRKHAEFIKAGKIDWFER
jgi:hypothetical protein